MNGTRYPTTVRPPESTMLKPGANNKKLGAVVKTGPLTGAVMYSLSLEERKTCPRSCLLWNECYGNNMPFAHRYDHAHPSFQHHLARAVNEVCDTHKRVLIRLHVLGDFFSTGYVAFWDDLLASRHELHLFGYTAHAQDSDIGGALHRMSVMYGWHRCAIRFSGLDAPHRAANADVNELADHFTCPEQLGRVKSCAACGACWNGDQSVRFIPH